MTSSKGPVDVSEELAKLRHEKKNQSLHRLPPNTTVQRRPLNHAPVASIYAGADVQKVVYVSRKTPVMSAVKRVKKLLAQIEKRAVQSVKFTHGEREGMRRLNEASEKLGKEKEEVLVKASGRAMEQALRVAEWFREREDEVLCSVEVRTGSVRAVDDIVEKDDEDGEDGEEGGQEQEQEQEESRLEGGETTLELLGDLPRSPQSEEVSTTKNLASTGEGETIHGEGNSIEALADGEKEGKKSKKKRRKRKRPMYAQDDLPEARIRWVNTVEVAISIKG